MFWDTKVAPFSTGLQRKTGFLHITIGPLEGALLQVNHICHCRGTATFNQAATNTLPDRVSGCTLTLSGFGVCFFVALYFYFNFLNKELLILILISLLESPLISKL